MNSVSCYRLCTYDYHSLGFLDLLFIMTFSKPNVELCNYTDLSLSRPDSAEICWIFLDFALVIEPYLFFTQAVT